MKYIEGMWKSFESMTMPADSGAVQRDEMRKAFFCGAAGLLTLIVTKSEPGEEPTDNDMAMMKAIQDEVDQFGKELDAQILGPKAGRA